MTPRIVQNLNKVEYYEKTRSKRIGERNYSQVPAFLCGRTQASLQNPVFQFVEPTMKKKRKYIILYPLQEYKNTEYKNLILTALRNIKDKRMAIKITFTP